MEPLLELFLTGYNACLLIAGEKGSGKTYTLAGDNSHTGLIQMALDHIFQKLSDGMRERENMSSISLKCMSFIHHISFLPYVILQSLTSLTQTI